MNQSIMTGSNDGNGLGVSDDVHGWLSLMMFTCSIIIIILLLFR